MPQPKRMEVMIGDKKVVVRELSFGELLRIMEKATENVVIAGEVKQVVNRTKLVAELVKASVEGMTHGEIMELPASLASKLIDAVMKVNPLAE